jgi:2-polyprenyl-6-methoxyphenol hydroxylase-like FAD-dependent oxidoreductase
VLESDAAFDARKQGYGLTVQGTDLRDGLGIDLTADDAPSTSHYTFKEDGAVVGFFGEAFGTGGEKSEKKASSKERASARFAHVPRQIMRLRMLERLKPGTVRWGSRVRSFEETSRYETSDAVASSRRAVRVTLEDGSVIDACLLVGSDGIHSTTRRLLRLKGDKSASSASDPDKLTFCGLAVVLGIVDDATFFCRLAKRRVFETVDGSARIYAMPFTTTSTMWQLSFPCSEKDARRSRKTRRS